MATVTWTDEKIDVLAEKVDAGFARAEVEYARTDERFKRVDERFDEVDNKFEAVDRRFDRVETEMKTGFAQLDAKLDAKFDGLQRVLLQIAAGSIGTLIAGTVTLVVALIVTH